MFSFPSLLRPNSTETLMAAGQSVVIPKVSLQFRPWQGPPISDTFGGKPLLDFAGRPVFAELAVYELFRLSGWDARWIETYGAPATRPNLFTNWLEVPRKQQQSYPILEIGITGLLSQIAAYNQGSYAGCWDVMGWHSQTVVFAELKRHKKDRLQDTQPKWLQAGLQAGLSPENFLLVEWDFLP